MLKGIIFTFILIGGILSCKEKSTKSFDKIDKDSTVSFANDSNLQNFSFPQLVTPVSQESVEITNMFTESDVISNRGNENQLEAETPDYTVYDDLLQKHVTENGQVNYKKLLEKKKSLDDFLQYLGDFESIQKWSKNEQLAYWINLYNASTIQLILENYPVKSIINLEDGHPFDVKRISVKDKMLSLNEIENDIIRPKFKDPRVHFALNCAAKSCPPLYKGAFTAKNIDLLLNQRTKSFINSGENTITSNEIRISRIFDWYRDDFGNVYEFLKQYSRSEINENINITYTEYDWSFNESF